VWGCFVPSFEKFSRVGSVAKNYKTFWVVISGCVEQPCFGTGPVGVVRPELKFNYLGLSKLKQTLTSLKETGKQFGSG